MMPRRAEPKRNWPPELEAQIAAETLVEGKKVNAAAKRYELIPGTVFDWRRMARRGKLVLPNLDEINFVPVEIEGPAPSALKRPELVGDHQLRLRTRNQNITVAARAMAERKTFGHLS